MGGVTLRPAAPADAADLAILDNVAGHGISQWFWQREVVKGVADDAYDFGRSRFADENSVFGWKNARVAVENGMILGAACSYRMEPMPDGEKASYPEEFLPVFDLFQMVVGDWVVDSLAVYQAARGKGVGALLLDDCFSRARATGVKRVSLVAEDANESALQPSESRGMSEQARLPYLSFGFPSDSRHWLLLTATVE